MADVAEIKDEVRTTVILTTAEANAIKASAKLNKRGWTNEIVILAMRALQPRRGQKSED